MTWYGSGGNAPQLRTDEYPRQIRRDLGALIETTFDCPACGLLCTGAQALQQGTPPRCPNCGNQVEITRVRINR